MKAYFSGRHSFPLIGYFVLPSRARIDAVGPIVWIQSREDRSVAVLDSICRVDIVTRRRLLDTRFDTCSTHLRSHARHFGRLCVPHCQQVSSDVVDPEALAYVPRFLSAGPSKGE
jgi:hypothetical protein